jgi:hypothetical protein
VDSLLTWVWIDGETCRVVMIHRIVKYIRKPIRAVGLFDVQTRSESDGASQTVNSYAMRECVGRGGLPLASLPRAQGQKAKGYLACQVP